MTAVALSKPEIIARLMEIHSVRFGLDLEEAELWGRLQRPKREISRPVPLTFGKDIITWGDGQALVIRGKGYKIVKALYKADNMRLTEETLDRIVWNGKVSHPTFTKYILRLAEKLEQANFPYQLLPMESEPKVETTGEVRNGKPIKRFIDAVIIGVRLHRTVKCPNVRSK
jgi:hypothetical protein